MRDLLRRVRRTPERLLHPLRRRKLVEALRTRTRPKTVLVVCHGNICRSPVAAALLARELARDGVTVESGGFAGFNRPAPPVAVAAAERHGLNLADHRSRLLTADLVRGADLIVVMDETQQRLICERYGRRPADVLILGDLDPAAVETRTIHDPVNDGREVFDWVYERIARCVRELAIILNTPRATPS
jgi:protein-tyrosine phosphatase